MFCTVIFGLSVILTPILAICFMTCFITSLTCATLFVPVQTKLPDENTKTADFGFFTLKTNPGNCSGLYSVFDWTLASFVRETGLPREVVATIFWTLRSDFDILIVIVIYKEGAL